MSITAPKKYELGAFQGFPFAIDEIANLDNANSFAAVAAMLWGVEGFDPYDTTKNYILTGCIDDGAGSISAGWVCMGGTIAQVLAGSYSSAAGLTLNVHQPESILWSDGQSRNSVFQHRAAAAEYTGQGDVLLSDFIRVKATTDMVLAANWAELVNPVNRGGIKIRLFRGYVELSGTITWTGGTLSATNQKICDLPSWAIPPNGWSGITMELNGGVNALYAVQATNAGVLQVSGELTNGADLVLDNLRWSV